MLVLFISKNGENGCINMDAQLHVDYKVIIIPKKKGNVDNLLHGMDQTGKKSEVL